MKPCSISLLFLLLVPALFSADKADKKFPPPSSGAISITDEVPASAADNKRLNREAKEQFDTLVAERLRDADSIVVSCLIPASGNVPTEASLKSRDAVRDLVAHIKARVSETSWIRAKVDGKQAFMRTDIPCQCSGEFEFSFYDKGVLLASFSVHHQAHMRSEVLTANTDVSLESDSADRLYKIACDLLPYSKSFFEKPNRALEHILFK